MCEIYCGFPQQTSHYEGGGALELGAEGAQAPEGFVATQDFHRLEQRR